MIYSKADVVDCVTENALKFISYVDSSDSILRNFSLPLVTGFTEVLLVDLTHHGKLLLVKHRRASFSMNSPLFIGFHNSERVFEDQAEQVLDHNVLVHKLIFRRVNVLHYIGV